MIELANIFQIIIIIVELFIEELNKYNNKIMDQSSIIKSDPSQKAN